MTSNIPWFKLALVGTFIGVSALIGYAAVTRNAFASSETAETIESKGKSVSFMSVCVKLLLMPFERYN